jgi:hypothetical protein
MVGLKQRQRSITAGNNATHVARRYNGALWGGGGGEFALISGARRYGDGRNTPGRLLLFLLTIPKESDIYRGDLHTRDGNVIITIGTNNAIISSR